MALSYSHGAIQWLSADGVGTTYTVSGLSFQPKAIRFYMVGIGSATNAASGSTSERRGIGFATSTSSRRAIVTTSGDGAGSAFSDCATADDCVLCRTDSGGFFDAKLDINAINSDGFQLIVDQQPSTANITVFWEAWGGSDITNVTIGDIAEPAATGTQSYTATGFSASGTDQIVLLIGCQSTAAVGSAQSNSTGLMSGATTGSTGANNIVLVGNAQNGAGTMNTAGYNYAGDCLAMLTTASGNPSARATLSSFGTDQFTLNWTARGTTNRRYFYMAIKGGSWSVGSTTINANTGSSTATVSGLSFAPVGLSTIGAGKTQSSAGTATTQDRLAFGSGSSTSSRRSMGILDKNGTANVEINTNVNYDSVLSYPTDSGALATAIDINAMNSDGFQLIVDTAGGVASEWIGYVTFGGSPSAIKSVDGLAIGSVKTVNDLAIASVKNINGLA